MKLTSLVLVLCVSFLVGCGGGGDDPAIDGGPADGSTDGQTTTVDARMVDAQSSVDAASDPFVQCNVTAAPVVACDITNGTTCDELRAAGSMCSAGTTSPARCPTMKGTRQLIGICVTGNGNLIRFSYAVPAVATTAANSANTGCMTSPGYQRFCRLVP